MRTFLILTADFPGNESSVFGDDTSSLHPYPQITTSVPALEIADTDPPADLREVLRSTTFLLHEDASPTDVLSQDILPSPGLLISPGFADFLRQYRLPPECSFYETTVEHLGQTYPYFWLHTSGFHSGMIDFGRTRFARYRPEHQSHHHGGVVYLAREISVHNERELLAHLQELSPLYGLEEEPDESTAPEEEAEEELIFDDQSWDELSEEEQQKREDELAELALASADTLEEDLIKGEQYLDASEHELYMKIPLDYDLLLFPFPQPALFVYQLVAEQLEEESGLTGYTLLPFPYVVHP